MATHSSILAWRKPNKWYRCCRTVAKIIKWSWHYRTASPHSLYSGSQSTFEVMEVREARVDAASSHCNFHAYARVPYAHILIREAR